MWNLTGTRTGKTKLFYTLPFQFGLTTGTVLEREENGKRRISQGAGYTGNSINLKLRYCRGSNDTQNRKLKDTHNLDTFSELLSLLHLLLILSPDLFQKCHL